MQSTQSESTMSTSSHSVVLSQPSLDSTVGEWALVERARRACTSALVDFRSLQRRFAITFVNGEAASMSTPIATPAADR